MSNGNFYIIGDRVVRFYDGEKFVFVYRGDGEFEQVEGSFMIPRSIREELREINCNDMAWNEMKLTVEQFNALPPELQSQIKEALTPKEKPVDMSVLVGSGVDVWTDGTLHGEKVYTYLIDISDENNETYIDCDGCPWTYCKPRMNYWFSVYNFPRVDVKELLDRLRVAGFVVETTESTLGNLIAFKIVGLQFDRCWPWEVEK